MAREGLAKGDTASTHQPGSLSIFLNPICNLTHDRFDKFCTYSLIKFTQHGARAQLAVKGIR